MSEKIWSVNYIRENPELAAKAIETLQTAMEDMEDQLHKMRIGLDVIRGYLAEEKKEM
jgi:hypothetical protein